jgi:mono/diheme cytochrome c family protein
LGALAALLGAAAAPVWSQGMSSGGMREMMRGMMHGQVPPPGLSPEALPAPDSEGARLLAGYCTQCHDLPSPRYKTAGEWPAVFERMLGRMRMMSGGMMAMHRLDAPSAAEGRTLLAYLREHAMVPAAPEELAAGTPADRAAFASLCARCHALPSPSMHPPERWPGIVARMQANMQLMDVGQLDEQQREAVVRFLQTASRAAVH